MFLFHYCFVKLTDNVTLLHTAFSDTMNTVHPFSQHEFQAKILCHLQEQTQRAAGIRVVNNGTQRLRVPYNLTGKRRDAYIL